MSQVELQYEQAGVAKCPKCDGPLFWGYLLKFFLLIPALGCQMCGTYIHQFRVDIIGGKGKKNRKCKLKKQEEVNV